MRALKEGTLVSLGSCNAVHESVSIGCESIGRAWGRFSAHKGPEQHVGINRSNLWSARFDTRSHIVEISFAYRYDLD